MEQDEQEPTGIESDALNPDAAATKTQQTHGSDLPVCLPHLEPDL